MKKNLKKVLLFSLFLVLIIVGNENLAEISSYSHQSEEEINPDTLLLQQFNRASNFFRKGEFQYAEQSFRNAIVTIKNHPVTDTLLVYRTYVNFGVLENRLGKRDEALKFYDIAEKFTINEYGSDSNKLIPIYVNKGIVYSDLGNFFKAQNHYERSLELIGNGESRYLSQINNNLAVILYRKEDFRNALKYYKESLHIKKKNKRGNKSITYSGIANCYTNLGSYSEAEKYYKLSINDVKSNFGEDYYLLADSYLNYAVFLDQINEHTRALKNLNSAYQVYLKNYGLKHSDTAHCLLNFGDWYHDTKKDYELALNYYQKAMISELENFQNSSIYSNPALNDIDPQISILNILKAKAKALQSLYEITKNIKKLDFGLLTFDLCFDIIDKIRIGYQDEESKFALSSNEKETYTQAIDIAVELYELTKNPIYKEKAFRYAERSKAASLMSSLNDVNAKNFAGIPVELQEEELHLRKDIAKYREKVYEERRKTQPNREKIAKWQAKLFELNESYDQMVLRFEEEYPEYYALKYSHKTIELSELQSRLASDETLIEYSISDSALFTFIVTADSFEITKQDIHDLNLDHHIEEVRNALKTNDFGENSSEYYKRYTESAHELYKIFVAPHDKAIQNKKLIIVPDGKMAYVPFGVLIKSEANSNRMNYRDLDYLIKSHTITYQNSATIGFTIESAGFSILSSKSVLAFAPSYKGVDDSILYTERAYRDKLYPLPYTKEEVNNISNVMKGDLYLDDLATEQNFKNNASNYDVLHLAMHTIIDDENPMYSKLVFTQTNDTIQDGLLNTHEIYNMNFNARMVVLSACNTGDGKLLKGEGVMSLARGFFYAGCPSIIMTLWTVEDQTGSNLMTNFYANLSEGLQKDQALRNAKLKYLETADPLKSHPYFWSGYVTMGDVEPLYNLNMKNNLVYMGLGGLVLLVLFVFRRKIVRRKTA